MSLALLITVLRFPQWHSYPDTFRAPRMAPTWHVVFLLAEVFAVTACPGRASLPSFSSPLHWHGSLTRPTGSQSKGTQTLDAHGNESIDEKINKEILINHAVTPRIKARSTSRVGAAVNLFGSIIVSWLASQPCLS